MIESQRRFLQEHFTGWRRSNAGMVPRKELGTNAIFQIPNSPAYCGLLHIQCSGGSPKTAMLGRGQRVFE
jgi:hypothetical protein